MIDPPTLAPGSEQRRAELQQPVDYASQRLVEEARSVGWTAVEFLTSVMDADARLSALIKERLLEQPATDGAE